MSPAPSPRFRLHLENARARHPLFHMSAESWEKAAARHGALAARIDVTIGWDGDILASALADADGMIAGPIDRRRIAAAPRLKWLHSIGAGVDQLLPMDWLPAHITVTNSSGVHAAKAEDYVSMALLMLHTRMPEMLASTRARKWNDIHTHSIAGRTALVLGFGGVGAAAGRGAKRLGMKVIAVTRSGTPAEGADEVFPVSRLDSALPRADFVVVATPLTQLTRHLLDARRISLLKHGAGLINIGRAAVVDYYAVAARLASGDLSGAVIDIFDTEPLPPASPWWDVPNLIITPHVSCDTPDYIQDVFEVWFENFGRLAVGKELHNQVDRKLEY